MGSDRPPLPCKEDHQPLSLAGWDGEAAFHVVEGCPRHDFTPFDLHGKLVGLPCHRTCYMLLITHFKYKLKLRDVQSLQTGRVRRARLMGGEYGGMLDYQYEYFLYAKMGKDGNFWMIENPEKCERNAQRILEIWRPFAKPLVEKLKRKGRWLRNGPCTALLCSFKHASLRAAAAGLRSSQPAEVSRLHKAMAALPSDIVMLIVKLADLAYTKEMADAVV